jgi:hypothetical protein
MPLGDLDLVTVTGKYVFLDGTDPRDGSTVTFAASVVLREPGTPQIILGAPITVELAEDGSFSIAVPATDDPDVEPTGFTYQVKEKILGPAGASTGRTFNLAVPLNTPGGILDLVTAAPAQAASPSATYVLASAFNTLADRVTVLEEGGGGGTGVTLANSNPSSLGEASPGVNTSASRGDHIHPTTGLSLAGHGHPGVYDPAGSAAAAQASAVQRANHQGAQPIATVSGLQDALDGRAPTVHEHAATQITSGLVPTGRLGAGTPSPSTFLRGDQTWGTPPSGGGGGAVTDLAGTVTVDAGPTLGQIVDYYQSNGRAILVPDVAADGATDDTQAMQDAVNQAVAEAKLLLLPAGRIRCTGEINATIPTSFPQHGFYMQGMGGSRTTLQFKYNGHGLVVGAASGQAQTNDAGGVISDLRLEGNPGTLGPPPALRSGYNGLQLRGMPQFSVENVSAHGWDSAFELRNNCWGAQFKNCVAKYSYNNVGMNLRQGQHTGSDISFFNCWLHGRIAGYYIGANSGGYRIKHGQISCGANSTQGEGGMVIGRDYLTGDTGQAGIVSVEGVDLEGIWAPAPFVRAYDRITAAFRDCSFLSTGSGASAASRILHWTNPGNGNFTFEGNCAFGQFGADDILKIDGAGLQPNGYIMEYGWVSSHGNVVTPAYNEQLTSLLAWPGNATNHRSKGVAIRRTNNLGRVVMGGGELRINSGVLEMWNPSLSAAWDKIQTATARVNPQSGTSYALATSDLGKTIESTGGSPFTLTVPANLNVDEFPVGGQVEVHQYGAGQVTVVAASGVTLNALGGNHSLAGQSASAVLRRRATNEYQLVGALA